MPRGRPPNFKRRRLIAKLRAAGLTHRQIGQRLGVSRQSVQQALRHTDQAKLVPIRCQECGAAISRMRTVHNNNGQVYCVGCLPNEAPFGQRLKAYRVAAKLTQAELAARIGVTPSAIHYWERGSRSPVSAKIAKLTAVLGAGLKPGT
jgi:transcriptional regulator with XRE-family HTH domain